MDILGTVKSNLIIFLNFYLLINMTVTTRFAPSPTGHLHIGGARTALFNWLFARANGGKFLLRIEDTDQVRSTPEATEAILNGLKWLNLNWDDEPISQRTRQPIHQEMALKLLKTGHAYKCFATPQEIADYQAEAKQKGNSTFFVSPWRDASDTDYPDKPFTIRVKAPLSGKSLINDIVLGQVSINNDTLDDFVILRSDGSPTYNFAVVVDDHAMDISHIIRGNDHIANTFKQKLIYQAFNWSIPNFAHVPLIHNQQGKKFSKRDGAEGVEVFFNAGIIPEAACNFLARLGWSHGDDEFFCMDQAIKWFRLEDLRKSSARYDPKILNHLSRLHLANLDTSTLLQSLKEFVSIKYQIRIDNNLESQVQKALPFLQGRSKNLVELWEELGFLWYEPGEYDQKSIATMKQINVAVFDAYLDAIEDVFWTRDSLEQFTRELGNRFNLGLGKVIQPIRIALVGKLNSPSVFDLLIILGKDESLYRMKELRKHLN